MAILEPDEHAESEEEDEEAPRRPGAVEVDEDTIEALTALLSYLSNEEDEVREAAAKAAGGLSGTVEGREVLMESKLDPIEKLVPMMDDTNHNIATLALAAIVNLCEYENAARGVVVKAGAMPKAMERVASGFEALRSGSVKEVSLDLVHGAKLLANLTRHHDGRQAAVGFLSDGSQAQRGAQVRRLADALGMSAGLSTAEAGDAITPLCMFFENIAAAPGGATLLCSTAEEYGFMLLAIGRQMASTVDARRMCAAGAIKNCCFERTVHPFIAENPEVAALLCLPLVGDREGYDDEDLAEMPGGLARKCRLGSTVTEKLEMRELIYEAMMLLCRSLEGREYFRTTKIYPILREVHKFEEGFQKPQEKFVEMIEDIVDKVVLLDEPAAQVD